MPVCARIVPVILLSALVSSACDIQVGENGVSLDVAQSTARDEWRRTYTLAAGGRLEISNRNGGIDVEPASGRDVEVVVDRRVRGGPDEEARAFLQALKMTEQVTPDSVRIEAQLPDGAGESRNGVITRNRVTISYRVKVPAGLRLTLSTGNGGVKLEDVTGQIDASTTNGEIDAIDVSGSVKATAVNGGIRVEMQSMTGDVEVSVTNGGIRVELPPGVKATLDATCVNGGISVDDSLGLQASETSRRRVTGTLNGGGPKLLASTVNGGIRIDAVGRD